MSIKKFVIGLNGDINSAVAAKLVEQMADDPSNIVCVVTPNMSRSSDQFNAIDFAESNGYTLYQVPITLPVLDIMCQVSYSGVSVDSSKESMLHYVRMAVLNCIADNVGGIVVSTYDKTQKELGSIESDGCFVGDIDLIGDMTHEQVVSMGFEIGVCDSIMNKRGIEYEVERSY